MIKIGRLSLNESPRVAVSLKKAPSPKALAAMRRAGVDLAELRVDLMPTRTAAPALAAAARLKGLPVLATVRSRREGGRWTGDDESRVALYAALLPRVDAVDVELSSGKVLARVAPLVRKAGKKLVVSFHDFSRTPGAAELASVLRRAKRAGADVVKIAALARGPEDVRALGAFLLKNRRANLIVIAMGKEGALSRVLFPALGSLVTFASHGPATAPGQFSYRDTLAMLKRLGARK